VKPFSAVFTDFEIKNSSEPPMRSSITKQPLAENSLPDGSDIPQWGRLDSPFNSSFIEAKDNNLRMNLLPKINDYNFSSVLVAPVTVNRVKGDFVQEVTVAPIHNAKWFGQYLYFRDGNSHMFRFGPAWDSKALFDIHASGFNYSFYTPPCTFQADFTRPMRLRLRREGQLFYAAIKQGDRDWQEMAPFYLNCAEELEVGVTALNTSDRPLEAIFTDYTLKTQP
jgi:regulation of enolase protein 1 (concanavalin A-like superfamily)